MKKNVIIVLLTVAVSVASAREYHVSVSGNDLHEGAAAKPLRIISAAARLAQPIAVFISSLSRNTTYAIRTKIRD